MHARAERAMRTLVSKQLDQYSLTMMEWLALGIISNAPHDGFSMSQVAEALDVTLPQVTSLVSNLTNMKLIKQKVLSSDRRGRQVIITPKGSRIIDKLEQRIAVVMQTWNQDIPSNQLLSHILTVSQLSEKHF